MFTTARCFALALGLILAAACSESTGTNSGDELTAEEANLIFGVLAGFGSLPFVGSPAPPAELALAPPINQSINESNSCPDGGLVSVSGTVSGDIDETSYTGTLSFDLTETATDCKVSNTVTTFTINDDPEIKIRGDIMLHGHASPPTGSLRWNGGISWSATDGRSGTCASDVTVDFTNNEVSGNLCGRAISGP